MAGKRQLSLKELFAPAQTSPKRARLSVTTVGSSGTTTSISTSTTIVTSASDDATPAAVEAFRESLSTAARGTGPSEKELLALECETLDPSWHALLRKEIRKQYFLKLKEFLWTEGVRGAQDSIKGKVFPAAQDIYAWSRLTPLDKVKVVIIGQDPYHDDNQAHGLCFSVKKGVRIPPSLRNIYQEIKAEYPSFVIPKDGNLESWAREGVLLLNTSLTVKPHTAGSHSNKGWEEFTQKLVDLVAQYGGSGEVGKASKGVVFLAWGAWAGKRVAKLDKRKHLILTSAHPSPLSAHRGFMGNGHFKKANDWLESRYGEDAKIDWTKL